MVRQSILGFDWELYRKAKTTISGSDEWLVPNETRVTYFVSSASTIQLQIYDGSSWYAVSDGQSGNEKMNIMSDGVNVKVINTIAVDGWFYIFGVKKKVGRA